MGKNLEQPDDQLYWRDKRLRDRLGFALEHDKLYKDIHFLLGKQEIRISAHKLILRLSSVVFENIITAHEQQGIDEIRLPNTSPEVFRKLLKFVYTDEIEMFDLSKFLDAAREFGFSKLDEQVLQVLKKTKLNVDNAAYLLDIGKQMNDKELESNSLNYIVNNGKQVLNSSSFVQISHLGLCQILLEDRLAVDELEVFKSTMRWAEFQCTKSTLSPSSENIREVLKDARLYIRYFQIDYEDFLSQVKPTGILASSEFIQVCKHFADPTVNLLGLPIKPRAVLPSVQKKQIIKQNIEYDDMIPAKLAKVDDKISNGPPPPEDDRTTEFRMFSTFIDFRELLDSIQQRYGVSKVILHDVIVQNAECYRGRRVHLPNLDTFYFYLKPDDPALAPPALLPDRSFMCGLSSKDFLFFEKNRIVPWEFKDLWGLVEAAEIFYSLTEETELKSLCVTASNFAEVEDAYISSMDLCSVFSATSNKLTTLVLQGVEFKNPISAIKFINLFPNLKYLSLYIVNNISIDFQIDLQQRATLEKITLSKVDIKTYKKRKGVIPFVKCEELYLDVCSWPPVFGEHFSLLFPNLRKVVIRSMGHCRCSARLFTELLEIKPLKHIAICTYPGPEDPAFNNPNLNIFLPPNGVSKKAVFNFLTKAGVQLNAEGPEVPNFILEKNFDANKWKTIPDAENDLLDQMHFELSMLDRFFDDRYITKLVH
ncbi:uncharacterized protein LOC110846163 isoform X2 [Folsomia candida]|uniref:uncharacterized protein LOC110846163 isoform X2 n=1 Tax=Folsomia candida TaxID=158441 RepID=UPI001604D416|nr:uncharacterized protein LOC110846163 isoform X2 [Folsomia candida]